MAAELMLSMGLAGQVYGAHEGGGESGAAEQQLGASIHRGLGCGRLSSRDVPLYCRAGWRLRRVLTDEGPEFKGQGV